VTSNFDALLAQPFVTIDANQCVKRRKFFSERSAISNLSGKLDDTTKDELAKSFVGTLIAVAQISDIKLKRPSKSDGPRYRKRDF
jgi:hypothetical protein